MHLKFRATPSTVEAEPKLKIHVLVINKHWFITTSKQLDPKLQLLHHAEFFQSPLTSDNYLSDQQAVTKIEWSSAAAFIFSSALSLEERQLLYESMDELKQQSDIAKCICALYNNDKQLLWQLQQKDVLLPLILQFMEEMQEKNIAGLCKLALKIMQITGFECLGQEYLFTPLVSGFALLLAIFDCFPDQVELIEKQLNEEVYFWSPHIISLVQSFRQDNKRVRLEVLDKLIRRFTDLWSATPRTIEFICSQMQKYYLLLDASCAQIRQSYENSVFVQEQKQVILRTAEVTAKSALSTFRKEDLKQLAQQALKQRAGVRTAIQSFTLFFLAGEPDYLEPLFGLLCLERRYSTALVLANKLQSDVKRQYCYLKLNRQFELKETSERILARMQSKQPRADDANSSCDILLCYQETKLLSSPEHVRLLGAMIVYIVLRRDRFCEERSENFPLQLFVLSRLCKHGIFLEKSAEKMVKLLKFARKTLQPQSPEEQIARYFIEDELDSSQPTGRKPKKPKRKQNNAKLHAAL